MALAADIMCGICGVFGQWGPDQGREAVVAMMNTIEHRGPDADGLFLGESVGLGHRRLSIIDTSSSGAQPMSHGDSTLVYNGEAYNFVGLRQELMSLGHKFVGGSDTEVVLHAYEEWGLTGLERLEGIFALALWDARRRKLILMRDRLGVKPLFYAAAGGRFAFGSEIKAVLAGLDVDRTVDSQALSEYLWYGNAFEERTIYKSVRSLEPGGRLIVDDQGTSKDTWFEIEHWLSDSSLGADEADVVASVRRAVDEAVTRQLVSDVPIGIFLSGGIDSSSIAVSAAESQERGITSFSVGFDFVADADELQAAGRMAHALGFEHHELRIAGAQLDGVISELVSAHDEPFADAANIPLYLLCQEIRGDIKVVLQGDGGDEMFAGYRRYALLNSASAWRCINHALGRSRNWVGAWMGRRLDRLVTAAGSPDPAMRMALLLTMESQRDPPTAMLRSAERKKLEAETDPFLAYRRCADRFANENPVQQMLLTDIQLQLPSQFLPKVDRSTMAHGIEARVPLLDERVASVAVGLPSALKIRRGSKKWILRKAMRGRVPDRVLDAPKRGFGVPYSSWLRTSLHQFMKAAVLDRHFVERFGFDSPRLEAAVEEHQSGKVDRGFLLWKLLQLSLWSQRYQ
ncbi:MAG: asparagine synthase (glutamine-hydrolyzing) [Pseudomonadota bacterium]